MIGAAVVVVGGGSGVALAVGMSHHSNPPPTAASTSTTSTAPAAAAIASGPTCPLSGVPSSGSVPARPALAIKVDNSPTARPQSGLDKADIVFEEPVEGGITRLVAVFQCQDAPLVGDIRSARAVDVPILDQLSDPLFIHAGGIPPVLSLLAGGNLKNEDIFAHGGIAQHPAGRYAPYDTYTTTALGWGLDPADTTPPAPLFTYASVAPAGGAVGSVQIPFSSTNDNTWTWNATSSKWTLAIGGVPAMLADGSQISAANIVVQKVNVTYGPWQENAGGGLEVQSQLTGSGPLEVFRNGVGITGTWQRGALGDPTSLVAANGTIIPLAPGPTWVEIVPQAIAVTAH